MNFLKKRSTSTRNTAFLTLAALFAMMTLSTAGSGLDKLEKSERVEIKDIKEGTVVSVADEQVVARLRDNILHIKLKQEDNTAPSEFLYNLKFFNGEDQELLSVMVISSDWIQIEGNEKPQFIIEGRIDLSTIRKSIESSPRVSLEN